MRSLLQKIVKTCDVLYAVEHYLVLQMNSFNLNNDVFHPYLLHQSNRLACFKLLIEQMTCLVPHPTENILRDIM